MDEAVLSDVAPLSGECHIVDQTIRQLRRLRSGPERVIQLIKLPWRYASGEVGVAPGSLLPNALSEHWPTRFHDLPLGPRRILDISERFGQD
jgi:hypothetical protein